MLSHVECVNMPFLVPRGTRCRVIRPDGRVIDPYLCRESTAFSDDQTKPYGLHLQFEREGFRMIVAASAAVRIDLKCAVCGAALQPPS